MARQVLENGVILPAEYSDDWYDDMTSNLTKLDDVIGSDSEKLSSADVGAAALSNNYNDLDNLPTIPTVNDATLTIQKNGVDVQTFTANASSNVTANITVPTKTSDITNDSNFVDTSNPAVASGITSTKVTDYDTHIADTDIHVTTADKTTWNTVTSKANDSDVVHKSGNETIAGDKVFNNRLIKNIDVVLGTAPSTGKFSNIDIADNNKAPLLQISGGVYDTGNSYARLFVQNKTADDGTGLSPTGTLRTCGFTINFPATSTSEGQGSITPRGNKTTDLGLLNYQWRNVWCEKLFLNGTQLDPSAFVTTDTAQTISGAKTFSENIVINNSDTSQASKRLIIKSSKVGLGDNNSDSWGISFDAGSSYASTIKSEKSTSSMQGLNFTVRTKDGDNNFISAAYSLKVYIDGSAYLSPSVTDYISLGSNSEKWKDTCTNLINGLEPSSLSLPSRNASNFIDISSYITALDGTSNSYTVPANGWISISVIGTAIDIVSSSWSDSRLRASSGNVRMLYPVLKNETVDILVSGTTLTYARFIPCQGNV